MQQLVRSLVDLALQVELRLLGQRDVGRNPDEPDQLPVRPEARLRHAAQPAIFAVMPQIPPLKREALARSLPGDALGDDALDILRMDLRTPVEAPRRIRIAARPAGEIGISLVDEIAHAIEPGHPHHRRRRIGDPPEPRLALAQRLLGDHLLGHVLHDDDDPAHLPGRVGPRNIVTLHRGCAALGMVELGGEEGPLPGERLLDHRHPLVERLVAEDLARVPPKKIAPRPPEPFGERLVDEAEGQVAIVDRRPSPAAGRRSPASPGNRASRRAT